MNSRRAVTLIPVVAFMALLAVPASLTALRAQSVPAAAAAAPAPAASHKPLLSGLATWYGKQFNGHHTASGERFDMLALTAAHRTLPLGSWLRVTNTANHRSVLVRVNDRGPMSSKYILDLSYGAAQAIGIAGYANVRMEALRRDDPAVLLATAPRHAAHSRPRLLEIATNSEGIPLLDDTIVDR